MYPFEHDNYNTVILNCQPHCSFCLHLRDEPLMELGDLTIYSIYMIRKYFHVLLLKVYVERTI